MKARRDSGAGSVTHGGREFRRGYTTGSCAAAAAAAAMAALATGRFPECVRLETPAGITLSLYPEATALEGNEAEAAIVKDGGDDPDMTTGLQVFARCRTEAVPGIRILGGLGVGVVTRPGLQVPPGEAAINPVPRRMIEHAVAPWLQEGQGVTVTISIPGGEVVAAKTYNPRLGITGGLSVLGTTGIVEPMSEEAWKTSLAVELDMLRATGSDRVVFVFGNYGEAFLESRFGIPPEHTVTMSNFVGYMLEEASRRGFTKALMAGHSGKLVKVAAGIFQTHSRQADARMETIAAWAGACGATAEVARQILSCVTTDAAGEILTQHGLEETWQHITRRAAQRASEYTFGAMTVGTVMFDGKNRLLALDEVAAQWLQSGTDSVS